MDNDNKHVEVRLWPARAAARAQMRGAHSSPLLECITLSVLAAVFRRHPAVCRCTVKFLYEIRLLGRTP